MPVASDPLFRLLIALGLSVAPSIMFLGLLHLLEFIRDDALIVRINHRHDVDLDGTVSPLDSDLARSLLRLPSDRDESDSS